MIITLCLGSEFITWHICFLSVIRVILQLLHLTIQPGYLLLPTPDAFVSHYDAVFILILLLIKYNVFYKKIY